MPTEIAGISRAVRGGLKDPDSTKFQWYPISNKTMYCGRVNSKNALGGYLGYTAFMVITNSENNYSKPMLVMIGGGGGMADDTLAPVTIKQCSENGYHVDHTPE